MVSLSSSLPQRLVAALCAIVAPLLLLAAGQASALHDSAPYDATSYTYDLSLTDERLVTAELSLCEPHRVSTEVAGPSPFSPPNCVYDSSSKQVAPSALSAQHRALALQNLTDSGDTVLGRYPGYIDKANSRGASYFDIGDEWDRLAAQGSTLGISTWSS